MGELNAARHIAKTPKANANSWCEMKKVLPLLAKEQHYKYLKSGKGRGGEAVIMIENVRMHADIANRHERPDHLSKRVKKKRQRAASATRYGTSTNQNTPQLRGNPLLAAEVRTERGGNGNAAVGVLSVFHNRDERASDCQA